MATFRKVGVIGALVLLCTNWSPCQPSTPLPTLQASRVTQLSSEYDPGGFCVDDFVKDSQGRLWIKPCGVAEQFFALRLIQFDGYNTRPIRVARRGWNGFMRSGISGYSSKLGLYGFLNRFPESSALYTFRPDLDTINYTPLAESIVGNVIEYDTGQFWVLAKEETAFILHHWDGEQFEELARIPNALHYNSEQEHFVRREATIFFQDGEQLWWMDAALPAFCFDLDTKEVTHRIERSMLPDFDQTPLDLGLRETARTGLAVRNDTIFLLHDQNSPRFQWRLPGQAEFQPCPGFPEDAVGKGIFEDEQGNLVFLYRQPQRRQGALLLDQEGQWWDYSPMLKDLPLARTIHGADFFNEIFLGTDAGPWYVTAAIRAGVQSLVANQSIRYIEELGPDQLLLSRLGWLQQLNDGQLAAFTASNCAEEASRRIGGYQLLPAPNGEVWMSKKSQLIQLSGNLEDSCRVVDLPIDLNRAVFLTDDRLALLEQHNSELYWFSLSEERMEAATHKGVPIAFNGIVHALYPGTDNRLWIGTNNGLFRVDMRTGAWKQYGHSNEFKDHRIVVIREDRNGLLWLGTANQGVHLFDPLEERVVRVIDRDAGLTNNIVVNILEDDDGDVWIGTFDGLSVVSSQGAVIANLNTQDGLSHFEFNRYAQCKASDGQLYFGTISGLNVIDPIAVKEQLVQGDSTLIYLTNLSYFDAEAGTEISYDHVSDWTGRIVLAADKRNLRLSMALSNYGYSQYNRFAYRLEGLNDDWNYLGDQHQLSLSNLPSGRYNLVINGIDHRGNWTASPIVLPIEAREFFYRQAWIYLLCLSPFLFFAWAWANRQRQEKIRLEAEVDRRTEQIQKDKALIEQQTEELLQLDEMKSRFFANISHELRTPLTLITGPLEQLTEEAPIQQNNRLRTSLQTIFQNSKRLRRLVEEMLDLARVDAQRIQLHEEPVPLGAFIRQLFDSFRMQAVRRGIDFQLQDELAANTVLQTDPRRLEKILSNLLSNAIKFTENGGQVALHTKLRGEVVVFSVSDTGRGIPPEDLPHVFERFFQSKRQELASAGGTGIGLSLSQELAHLLQGTLEADSRWQEGSTFTLSVPARLVAGDELARLTPLPPRQSRKSQAETSAAEARVSGARIAVVEDNAEVQEFIAQLLRPVYTPILYDNGQALLDALINDTDQSLPELILSDITMPYVDGYSLLEALKSKPEWQVIPVIMLTARTREEHKLRALRLGVDDFLTKPFSPRELLARVENLLDHYRNRPTTTPTGESSAQMEWLRKVETHTREAIEQQMDVQVGYLAQCMALSERQFSRRLKQHTGLSAGQYLQEARLQHARLLLENRTYPTVKEVAAVCGFRSASYFAKLFADRFGCSPSQYHEQD